MYNEIGSFSEELCYAAGLVDGEGSIGVYLNKVYNHYQLRLQVQMCDKEGLELLEHLFKGTWFHYKAKPPRRAKWQWLVTNSAAASALQLLKPYLLVKKKHAIEALKADWFSYNSKNPLTEQERNIRKEVSVRIKEFNKRGTN